MKNKKLYVFLLIFIVGAVFALAGLGDTKLLMSGEKLDLNTAQINDLDNSALIEGRLDFVIGPFATLEQSQKTYGITTSKTETNFYIVGNFNNDMYDAWYYDDEPFDAFYCVFATSDDSMMKKLDSAADKWYECLTSEDEYITPPSIDIEFKGKLTEQLSDEEYIEYYNDAANWLELEDGEVAFLQIRDGEVKPVTTYAIFFGGIAVAVIGLVGAIVSIISAVKKKKRDKEFDEAYGEY